MHEQDFHVSCCRETEIVRANIYKDFY
jgi:hypothetical protein